MRRDFSDSAEEEILGDVDVMEDVGYCITAEPSEIEDYELHSGDIQYHMNHIKLHHQYLIERHYYTREVIQEIFESVREFDVEWSENIKMDNNTTFAPYKRTMNALLDSIRLSPAGEPLSEVEYLQNAKMQYGQYGSFSSQYSSIFTSTGVFEYRMKEAGSGLVGDTVQALQEDAAFKVLMLKSIEEIHPWEVAALSRLFDDCMMQDENGKYQVDFEALSALIDRCYVQTKFRKPISQPDAMLPGSATYELAPIIEYLLLYRELQTDGLVSMYMNPDARKSMNLTHEFIISECYITDSIYGVSKYYSKIKLDSWFDEEYTNLHIGIDNSETGRIRLSVANDGDGDWKDITIYGFTNDLSTETNQANTASEVGALLDTEEEILIAVLDTGVKHTTKAVTGLIPGADTVMEFYGGAKEFYSIWEVYRSSKDNNAECYSKMHGQELQGMTNILNCSGTVIQYGDAVTVRHLAIDQRDMTIDVALYNAFVDDEIPPKSPITVSQLEEEFSKVIAGDAVLEDCAGIQAMFEFDRADDYDKQEHPIRNYYNWIYDYLKEQYRIENINDATLEQLEEAAENAAEKWRN